MKVKLTKRQRTLLLRTLAALRRELISDQDGYTLRGPSYMRVQEEINALDEITERLDPS